MSDGSLFAYFANFTYAQEHQIIYVYTREDNSRHELRVITEPSEPTQPIWAFATCSYQTNNSRTKVIVAEH